MFILFVLFLALSVPHTANAATTITVSSSQELSNAVYRANQTSGNVTINITKNIRVSTYSEPYAVGNDINVKGRLTINGNGHKLIYDYPENGYSPIIFYVAGGNVAVNNITFDANGSEHSILHSATSDFFVRSGNVTCTDCAFLGGTVSLVAQGDAVNLTLRRCKTDQSTMTGGSASVFLYDCEINAPIWLQGEASVTQFSGTVDAPLAGSSAIFAAPDSRFRLCGGEVLGSMYGIYSAGTVLIEDGSVRGADCGVRIEDGNLKQSGGVISDHRIGVYQNGTYELSADAAVDAGARAERRNTVFLTEHHTVQIPSGGINQNHDFLIDTEANDRTMGRVLVTTASASAADHFEPYFSLAYDEPKLNQNLISFNGAPKSAAIHSGTKNPAIADNVLFLTAKYIASYRGNTHAASAFYADDIEADPFFWNETTTFRTNREPLVRQNAGAPERLDWLLFRGYTYLRDVDYRNAKSEINYWRTEKTLQNTYPDELAMLSGNFEWLALYDVAVNLRYVGGKNANDEVILTQPDALDTIIEPDVTTGGLYYDYTDETKNQFCREEFLGMYDEATGDPVTARYSRQGHSLRRDARYDDEDIYKTGDAIDTRNLDVDTDLLAWAFLEEAKQYGEVSYEDDFQPNITLYVVWDRFPEITAYDRMVTAEMVRNTDADAFFAELLADAKSAGGYVDVWDNEDALEDLAIDLLRFDFDEVLTLTKPDAPDVGGVSVTYRAKDGAGNISYRTVTITVVSDTVRRDEAKSGDAAKLYTRYVDLENWRKNPFYEAVFEDLEEMQATEKEGAGAKLPDAETVEKICEDYRAYLKTAKNRAAAEEAKEAGALEPYSQWYLEPARVKAMLKL